MTRRYLVAHLVTAMLFAVPAQAQTAAFRCTYRAAFDTLESDSPTKSIFEKEIVGRRVDVLITDQPTATVTTDAFTQTMEANAYEIQQRGGPGHDWILFRRHSSGFGDALFVLRISDRTWKEERPIRFSATGPAEIAPRSLEQPSHPLPAKWTMQPGPEAAVMASRP
jgi:hypothetical protein